MWACACVDAKNVPFLAFRNPQNSRRLVVDYSAVPVIGTGVTSDNLTARRDAWERTNMSRLYYPPQIRTTLASGKADGGKPTEYAEQIAKVIPAEIITAYSGIIGAAHLSPRPVVQAWIFLIGFILCVIATPTYLYQMSEAGLPKRKNIVLSTIAFPIWAYFTSGSQVVPSIYDAGVGVALVLVFSLISGLPTFNS
jgi:hypothetical protein